MLDALKLSIQGKLQQRMVSPDLPLAYQNHAWVEIQRILAVIDAKAAEKEAASYEMQHRIVRCAACVAVFRGAASCRAYMVTVACHAVFPWPEARPV